MKKGFAYCGLSCDFCSEGQDCPGCKREGCLGKETCQCFTCCQKQHLEGCYECEKFPCDNHMLNKLRIRTFAKLISIYGEEKIYECLKRNQQQGIVYHYPGGHVGDYDQFDNEEDIMNLVLEGKNA